MVSLRWFDDDETEDPAGHARRRKEAARRDALAGRASAVKAVGGYDVVPEPGPDTASTTTPPPTYGPPARRVARLPRQRTGR